MAWKRNGSLRGPEGPVGPVGPQGPRGERGLQGQSTPTVCGFLQWRGGWFDPPGDQFTRLNADSGARLGVVRDYGGCTSISGMWAALVAPVSGIYMVSATQMWGRGEAIKGMGLTTNPNDGAKGVVLWQDVSNSMFGTVSAPRFLSKGTKLYAWTWNEWNTGMSPEDRDMRSEYSIVLMQEM